MPHANILVVEDNVTEQYALKQLLERFDFAVDTLSSGEEALEVLANSKYAAILMDVTLPGINGYECTKEIRKLEKELGRRTPIIALTGRAMQKDRQDSIDAGMDDYLSKPFDSEDLRRMLLRYVYESGRPNLKVLSSLPEGNENV